MLGIVVLGETITVAMVGGIALALIGVARRRAKPTDSNANSNKPGVSSPT